MVPQNAYTGHNPRGGLQKHSTGDSYPWTVIGLGAEVIEYVAFNCNTQQRGPRRASCRQAHDDAETYANRDRLRAEVHNQPAGAKWTGRHAINVVSQAQLDAEDKHPVLRRGNTRGEYFFFSGLKGEQDAPAQCQEPTHSVHSYYTDRNRPLPTETPKRQARSNYHEVPLHSGVNHNDGPDVGPSWRPTEYDRLLFSTTVGRESSDTEAEQVHEWRSAGFPDGAIRQVLRRRYS